MSAAPLEHAPVVSVHPVKANCCICGGAKHPTKVDVKTMKRSVLTKRPLKNYSPAIFLQQSLLNAHYPEVPLPC
jgi:hypothetical protein